MHRVTHLLSHVSFVYVVFAFLAYFIAQIIAAKRFIFIVRIIDQTLIVFVRALKVHFIGLLFNQVLPSSVGGDVIKGFYFKSDIGVQKAVYGLILDRVFGLGFLLLIVLVTMPFYGVVIGNHTLTADMLYLSLMAVLSLLAAVWLINQPKVIAFLPAFLSPVMRLFSYIRCFFSWRRLLELTLRCVSVHIFGFVAFTLLGYALGVQLAVGEFFVLLPLVFVIAMIPLSLAGWGLRELGVVGVFAWVGVSTEEALALSVMWGLLLMLASLPGAVLLFFEKLALDSQNPSMSAPP